MDGTQPLEVDNLVEDQWDGHWAWIGFFVDSKATPFTESNFLPVAPYKKKVTPLIDPFRIPILQSLIKRSANAARFQDLPGQESP